MRTCAIIFQNDWEMGTIVIHPFVQRKLSQDTVQFNFLTSYHWLIYSEKCQPLTYCIQYCSQC